MIERERLQELISQKATIWHDDYGEIILDEGCKICEVRSMNGVHMQWILFFEYEDNNKSQWVELDIDELEEDIETAKWNCEMHAERPEYFRPPLELKDNEKYKFTTAKGGKMSISKFVRQSGDVEWWLSYVGTHRTFYSYTEAVEYARKLFIGEE